MAFKVEFSSKALRVIKKLPKHLNVLLKEKLQQISINPKIGEKLSGIASTYRVRIGDYRVVYEVHDHILIVLVINFGHRKEVYRDL